jgi:hypothetical protein
LPPTARLDTRFCSLACNHAARFNTRRAARRMRIEVAGQVEMVTRVESEVLVELLTGSEFAAFVQERSDQSAD